MKKLTAFLLVLAMSLSVAFAWSCPSCGNEMNGKFCTECGTKKPEEVICPSCGTNYGETGPKFCMECGTKLSEATATAAPTAAPTAVPTATPAPTAMPAPEKVELAITGVEDLLNGDYRVTWTDNGNGPWCVYYMEKWSDDVNADQYHELTSAYWNHVKIVNETQLDIPYLVPGVTYWIIVEDSLGNATWTSYEVLVWKYGINATMDVSPRLHANGEYTDIPVFTTRQLAADDGSAKGLYVVMNYDQIPADGTYYSQFVLKFPNGVQVCAVAAGVNLFANGSTTIPFLDISWVFNGMEEWYGWIPTGKYVLDWNIEGQYVASGVFYVEEETTASDAASSGVQIVSVVENADGSATVTWTDANNNGPYEVGYVQKYTDDYFTDCEAGLGRWYDTNEALLGSYDMYYLVPGETYWIYVYDANGYGQHIAYTPAAAKAFPEFTMKMELTPIWRLGGGVDMTVSEFSSAEIAANMAEHGLELWIEYPQLARARDYIGVLAFTSPLDDSVVLGAYNFHMDQGAAGASGWDFFDLSWYLDVLTSNYGAVPVGTYTVTFYCDGEVACSTTFNVAE